MIVGIILDIDDYDHSGKSGFALLKDKFVKDIVSGDEDIGYVVYDSFVLVNHNEAVALVANLKPKKFSLFKALGDLLQAFRSLDEENKVIVVTNRYKPNKTEMEAIHKLRDKIGCGLEMFSLSPLDGFEILQLQS